MRHVFCVSGLVLALFSASGSGATQDSADASQLVRQLAQFPAAIDAGFNSTTGQRLPAEQQREAIYVKLRTLADSATPALQRGMSDADVQIRRNVALYLGWEGGNYSKHASNPLDI